MKKTILITGGAGFVGSNLAVFLRQALKDCRVVCFDNLNRSGSELNISRLKDSGIDFIRGDVRDLKQLLKLPPVDLILECSADPSVLASYENPRYTIDTNLIGTLHCLELAKRDRAQMIFMSTSRVYPIEVLNAIPFEEQEMRFIWTEDACGLGWSSQGVSTQMPLDGTRSLYGATKLCSEFLLQEYRDMYGLKGIINRLGVIAGPWQMGKIDQGIVGFWVASHFWGKAINYIGFGGKGKQVRDVVHIDDVCELTLSQINNIGSWDGTVFNAGGGRGNALSLRELTGLVSQVTGKNIPVGSVEQDRKADIRIYITDNSSIKAQTGWEPRKTVMQIVEDTYSWVAMHERFLTQVLGA